MTYANKVDVDSSGNMYVTGATSIWTINPPKKWPLDDVRFIQTSNDLLVVVGDLDDTQTGERRRVVLGFGFRNITKAASEGEITAVMKKKKEGLTFIHMLAVPCNKDVPNIPVHHLET